MAATRNSAMPGNEAIAEHAIRAAVDALDREPAPPQRSTFPLTQSERAELLLLAQVLGSGVGACINFATKYFCSLWLLSRSKAKFPRPQKPTKTNPLSQVEYLLNPEVLSAVQAVRKAHAEFKDISESDLVRMAVLHLCKKLLPAKAQRTVVSSAG
jgi:hypothetical protein